MPRSDDADRRHNIADILILSVLPVLTLAATDIALSKRYAAYAATPTESGAAEVFNVAQKAAASGDAVAQTNLGVLYEQGRGVTRDDAEATRLIRLASKQGFETAQHELAAMCNRGVKGACSP
ncbi:MAG: hypothetical protein P4L10_00270 [Acidobacteriaceae bacterium]|nr:hypothetical protein [Acidobacteriaceae bacterium]